MICFLRLLLNHHSNQLVACMIVKIPGQVDRVELLATEDGSFSSLQHQEVVHIPHLDFKNIGQELWFLKERLR